MASKKIEKGITCTVGAAQADGTTELIGPALMVYVTSATKVEPQTELVVGRKVLADFRRDIQTIGANRGVLALRVRRYGPDASDVEELRALLERLGRAGLADPGFGDPQTFLNKLFDERLAQGSSSPLVFEQQLVKLLEAQDRRFPMDSWQHDIEPALSEMEEHLATIGVTEALSRPSVQAVFDRYADEDDDQVARRHFCAAIAAEANDALSRAGRPERWFSFDSLPWEDDGEPFWLLVTPDQRAGLLREKVFKAPLGEGPPVSGQ
jgi:hypothetical protein